MSILYALAESAMVHFSMSSPKAAPARATTLRWILKQIIIIAIACQHNSRFARFIKNVGDGGVGGGPGGVLRPALSFHLAPGAWVREGWVVSP